MPSSSIARSSPRPRVPTTPSIVDVVEQGADVRARARAGDRARWCRGRRARRRTRAGCRRRSCRAGRRSSSAVTSGPNVTRAPIGTPPPRPLASGHRVRARCPTAWWANQSPVRPIPVWISSTTSSAPCARRQLAGETQVVGRQLAHPGLALDRLDEEGGRRVVDRGARGHRRRSVGRRRPRG